MLKVFLPLLTFIVVFIMHLLYFAHANFDCVAGTVDWFAMYVSLQEYYMGFSYAISLAFVAFSFMKFKECRKKAIGTGIGASAWVIAVWILGCFLVGCCGSPMWIVYVNLLGISILKIPKWSIAMISLLMVLLGFLWLRKKMPKYCVKGQTEDAK